MDGGEEILGLDPGSRRTGYAFVRFDGDRVVSLDVGAWRVDDALTRAQGLAQLVEQAEQVLRARPVAVAAVESLFQHKNARTALVLAEARGALLALLGRLAVPVVEYTPATIKQTICGFGRADKEQVRRALVLTVPGLAGRAIEQAGLDATDALAVAVAHEVHRRRALVTGNAPR